MTKAAILGIDLAKNAFQLHGVDAEGQPVLRRRVNREKLLPCGAVFPFAISTSICRSSVTVCSGLYLFVDMTSFLLRRILFHSTWHKNSGDVSSGIQRSWGQGPERF